MRRATTHDKGHGRSEVRTIETLTHFPPWLDWPGIQQACRITRTRTLNGRTNQEVAFVITSLSRRRANAARLLELVRSHWAIENRLHWVRDMTLGEDACRVRTQHAPQLLAALRNLTIAMSRRAGFCYLPRAMRRFMACPSEGLQLIRPSNSAAIEEL